jgi:GDP-4-dehydro-6-deoxy-D-mannose reductase
VKRPVVVTGGAGFAGSHLIDRLDEVLPFGDPVHAWRRPGGSPAHRASARLSWADIDLLDAAAVRKAVELARPAAIYHCAGSPHVASSWSDMLTPLQSNVLSTEHLLLAIEQHSPDTRLFVPSSALVYAMGDHPLGEEAALKPRTPYGVSKLAQEFLATRAHRDRGLATLVARPFNHIGPRQEASFVAAAFARQIAEIEAGRVEPVIKVGNLDARRDLTDVRDTVRAYQAITERGVPGRIYNVCSGRAYRIGDLLDHLVSLARIRVRVAVDPDKLRPSDVPVLTGDGSRIAADLGWRPEIPIERTLSDLLEYWRERVAAGAQW